MPLPVALSAVVEEIDAISDEFYAYVNRKTGELLTVNNEDLVIAETGYDPEDFPEWQLDILAAAEKLVGSNDYVRLPTNQEIHEWKIMEEFCHTLSSERQRYTLLDQIHGKGAFRKFRDTVDRYNLRDEWFTYRNAAFGRIAAEFLDEEGIPYTM